MKDVSILIFALKGIAGWFPLHGEDAADMRDYARNALDQYEHSDFPPSNSNPIKMNAVNVYVKGGDN